LAVLLGAGLLLGLPTLASAQSVASVVDQMQARYEQQMQTVDTYVVDTNLYTAYHEKVTTDGEPTYRTQTRMKGESAPSFASTSTPSVAYGLQFDRLKQHATYAGTETVNGVRSHVLRVDDPSKVQPEMAQGEATSLTYYVDAEQYVPSRMVMTPTTQGRRGPQASSVTVNMTDYRTVDGLTLPYRMEIEVAMNLSEKQRRQMEQAMAQMENMPEQQRKQMEQMMGNQMEMMKQMMSGEPVVVEVQSVQVNVELPEGMF
jgi:hypothetical protein